MDCTDLKALVVYQTACIREYLKAQERLAVAQVEYENAKTNYSGYEDYRLRLTNAVVEEHKAHGRLAEALKFSEGIAEQVRKEIASEALLGAAAWFKREFFVQDELERMAMELRK